MSITTTFSVTGMTCNHCVSAVQEEISALDGVSGVVVDLDPGGVTRVRVTGSEALSAQQMSHALDEAGDYQLVSEPGTA